MPIAKKIKQTMVNMKLPDDVIGQFDFEREDADTAQGMIELIGKMDSLLTREECLAVMEKQGCCKSGKRDADCKAFAKEHAGKTLAEKVALLHTVQYMMDPKLNDDGTITVTYGGFQNGVHTGKTTCSCGTMRKAKQPLNVSRTYCGCCAGHYLYHYQNALGVKLKLKEIVSSPLDSDGENPCSFTFEVIG